MGWSERVKAGSKDPVSPALIFDPGVVGLLCALLELGALVSFGVSRDGGSLSCTVTYNGAWDREWFRDAVELGAWLSAAAKAIEEEPPPAATSSSNGTPRRGR